MLKNCAQAAAVQVFSLTFAHGAAMAFVPISAERKNWRAAKKSGAADVKDADNSQKLRRRRLALEASQPVAAPLSAGPSQSIEDQLDLLWGELQRQMLELLTHGVAAPFQQRAFDKLDYSMKQCAKLGRERAENTRLASPRNLGAEELAAMLNKMDRRIDELAEDRFKKLAQRELHASAADGGRAGMDV